MGRHFLVIWIFSFICIVRPRGQLVAGGRRAFSVCNHCASSLSRFIVDRFLRPCVLRKLLAWSFCLGYNWSHHTHKQMYTVAYTHTHTLLSRPLVHMRPQCIHQVRVATQQRPHHNASCDLLLYICIRCYYLTTPYYRSLLILPSTTLATGSKILLATRNPLAYYE